MAARTTGPAGGGLPEIIDRPGVPGGFRLDGVDVDGQPAAALGGGAYRLSSGDHLDPGQERQDRITVHYAVEPNAIMASGRDALGSCDGGNDSDPTRGLCDKVTMEDDADGPENNDACTTAELRGSLSWEKVDAEGNLLAGSSWQIQGGYDTQNWTTVEGCTGDCRPGECADQDPEPGRFRIDGLGLFYLLDQGAERAQGLRQVLHGHLCLPLGQGRWPERETRAAQHRGQSEDPAGQ